MIKTLQSHHNDVLRALLRQQRIGKRLRQQDLAVLLGRGQGTVSKVERGERRLDILELRHWLHAMDVDFVLFVHELEARLDALPTLDARLCIGNRKVRQTDAAPPKKGSLSGRV